MKRLALALAACSSGDPPVVPREAIAIAVEAAPDASSNQVGDMAVTRKVDAPRTLAAALSLLRAKGFEDLAELIARREAQPHPKMKLTSEQALSAALAVLAVTDDLSFATLHAVMPRSMVELARAVRERGVTLDEASDIASYLVRVTTVLAFERLETFDENHSHVTGREWHEIDYTGEGMTWQSQQAYWAPRGVTSFEKREYIHAYFTGAEKLPHWRKIYRPRGRMADVR